MSTKEIDYEYRIDKINTLSYNEDVRNEREHTVALLSITKKCVKCKENQDITNYCKNKYSADGLYWVCNNCQKDYYSSYVKPTKCECGRIVAMNYLAKHKKTKLHKRYLELSCNPNFNCLITVCSEN